MSALYLGWDVGAWNCDGGDSQDALCALGGPSLANLSIVGRPWRGNFRQQLVEHGLDGVLGLTGIATRDGPTVVAIDTPLGWPDAFHRLLRGTDVVPVPEKADSNPYVFRQTELRLFSLGFRPLSAVRDMIGSQATKGQWAIAKAGLRIVRPGVWSHGNWTAIETYPSPARTSPALSEAFERLAMTPEFAERAVRRAETDVKDALWCALAAAAWSLAPEGFDAPPDSDVYGREGWIWLPRDCCAPKKPIKEVR